MASTVGAVMLAKLVDYVCVCVWPRLQEFHKSTSLLDGIPFQLQALEAALYIVTQQLGNEVRWHITAAHPDAF